MKKQINTLLLCSLILVSCNSVKNSGNEESSAFDSSTTNSENNSSSIESSSSLESSDSLSSSSSELSSSQSSDSSSFSSNSSVDSFENEPTTPFYKEKNVTHYLGSDNDLYRINIKTEDNQFPYDKEHYINGSLSITEQNPSNVLFKESSMRIKLRGNSSRDADKKPFKIKFDEKQSLFGLTKAKDWTLIANYYDKSNIRNYLAYITANKLNNLYFQPSSIFVDVYFNDEYYGLFLLCEQMEAKKGRVDIEDNVSKSGISSFLIEQDERAQNEYAGFAGSCYVSSGRYDFLLKNPDADDFVDAYNTYMDYSESAEKRQKALQEMNEYQKNANWLQSFMDHVSDSIYSLNHYEDYIDVDSFIDYYLVEEFFKNVDVGSTSQYYYIDQADDEVKLKAGPVWDFDIGSGIITKKSPNEVYYVYTITDFFMEYRDYYYNALFKDKNFERKVAERYTEVRDDVFASVFDEIAMAKKVLEKAQARNLKRWPITTERKTWIEQYALSDEYLRITTTEGHYKLLEDFLETRIKLLDKRYYLK